MRRVVGGAMQEIFSMTQQCRLLCQLKFGDGNVPNLPSFFYPHAQLELNLVLHVRSTFHALEISMHCLK